MDFVDDFQFYIDILTFAFIHGWLEAIDTSDVVRILLANGNLLGTSPESLPSDMWLNFLESPSEVKPVQDPLGHGAGMPCDEETRSILAKSFHLSQRYLFYIAHKLAMEEPNERKIQIAELNDMADLEYLPYYSFGQQHAAKIVEDNVYTYFAMKRDKPLIMAFAGPSKHGKHEMVCSLGALLRVDQIVISCAGVTTSACKSSTAETAFEEKEKIRLFEFLSNHTRLRSVVVLDFRQFDKTTQKLQDSFLCMMHDGTYLGIALKDSLFSDMG